MTGWILEKCEDAWTNYLSGSWVTTEGIVTPNFYRGNEEQIKNGPLVLSYSTDAQELEQNSGIYSVTLVIHFSFPFETGELINRNAIVEQLSKLIYNNPNLLTNLRSSTDKLSIMACYFKAHNQGLEEDCYVTNNLLEMVVSGQL
jgi:hypothetical protein